MKVRAHVEFDCNWCEKLSDYDRHICDFCGACDETVYLISEEFDFDLCPKCFLYLQIQMQKPLVLIEQSPTKAIPEEVKIVRKKITEKQRKEIFDRDGWKCVFCGDTKNLQVDHKFPFSQGGTTEMGNLQTLCKQCNKEKRDKIQSVQGSKT